MGLEKRHQRVIVCIALLMCPIWPCLFVYNKIRRMDRRPKPQAQHNYVIYIPAPEIPRPRPLTPPLGTEQGEPQRVVGEPARSAILRRPRTKSQSAFFRVLPLEIREMIYVEVLASESALFPKRVGNRLCCDRYDYEHFETIYKDRPPDEIEKIFKQHLKRPKETIMGLLTSCRRMYVSHTQPVSQTNQCLCLSTNSTHGQVHGVCQHLLYAKRLPFPRPGRPQLRPKMDHPQSAAINPACLDRYLQRLARQAPVLGSRV
ncbi:hypothetical protein BJX65DRAFT_285455 [Aspergillus insuetus]